MPQAFLKDVNGISGQVPFKIGHKPLVIGRVLGNDPEHLDYFKSVENMHREYAAFLRNIPFYGLGVACSDHPVVREMIEKLGLRKDGRRLLTYGTGEDADLRLVHARADGHHTVFDFEVSERVAGGARPLTGWTIPILGQHNVLNALAAVAVALDAGVEAEKVQAGLASFAGVKRRFQLTGSWRGVSFFDDYAHHPVEINAVLAAAKGGARGRVMAVVEPHRFTRVRDLFGEFCNCFHSADSVIVLPLYSAGEFPIDGIDQFSLAEGIRQTGHPAAIAVENVEQLVGLIAEHARSEDMVVFVGAGQSTEWAHAVPKWLNEREPMRAGGAV